MKNWIRKKASRVILSVLLLVSVPAFASKQDVTLTPKRIIYQLDKIEESIGTIYPKLTLRGFSFAEVSLDINAECNRYEGYFFKMVSLILRRDSLRSKEIDEIVHRCPNANATMLRGLSNISQKELSSEKSLKEYLRKFIKDDNKVNKAVLVYRKKKEVNFRKEIIPIFNKLVVSFEKDIRINNKDHAEYLVKLDRFPSSILKDLSKLLIAIRIKNKGWALRLFESVINGNHENLLFNMEPSFFTSSSQIRRFEERLKTAKRIYEKYLDDKIKTEMLMKVIDSLLPKDSNLKKEMQVKWSLQEIRKLASKRNYGFRFSWFWFSVIYSRASEVEAVTFLKETLTKDKIEREGDQVVPMFAYYYPIDPGARKAALTRIIALAKSKSRYDQYLSMELLQNNVIKKELISSNIKFRRARAILQRAFYRKVISDGIAIDFCLYNLYKLGDFDDDLLWWMVL